MVNNVEDNFLRIPCFRYIQAEKLYYSITLPMNQLERFLSIDNELNVLKRSQRLVDEKRVKKLINYLSQDQYIIPALTGFITSGDWEFEEIKDHANVNMGHIKLSLDCEIKLFDGQHRASGIISACKSSIELKNRLRKSSVTINVTGDLPLEIRQQFFSDINKNASKPSVSLSATYDKKNAQTQLAQKVIDELNLKSHIEFEKNVIAKDNEFKLYTFKAFRDSISKAFGVKSNTEITDELISNVVYVYSSWSKLFHWEIVDINYIRHETINAHNLMILTIGEVTKELLNEHDNNYFIVAEKIDRSRIDYLTSFRLKNLYDVCIEKETHRIKLDADSKYNLKTLLSDFIK